MSIGPMQIESKTNNDENQDSLELNDEESREIKTNLSPSSLHETALIFAKHSQNPCMPFDYHSLFNVDHGVLCLHHYKGSLYWHLIIPVFMIILDTSVCVHR